ncbi:nuclear transport factor 2 family protein [Flammeovirgaceae bacterium SG7u.111]|nr:nuclear transport factor 2 family protein [Flammeovirgaceae bacterium SG7u.132]WPO34365.1 nuclear transport factor 2 family protein [Flammeovirgaceae bacterium SG7u.111]
MENSIILLVLSMTVIFSSCEQKAPDNSKENVALVESFVGAVEAMDHNAMESFLAENYVGLGPSYGDSTNKAQAVENWKYNSDNLYEKIQYNKSRSIAVVVPDGDNKGEWVSNWAELQITYKNRGGKVTILANSVYQVEDGKIVKSFTFYNEADALRQLGYSFVAPY